jgi:Protein of unknown function (DUF3311)
MARGRSRSRSCLYNRRMHASETKKRSPRSWYWLLLLPLAALLFPGIYARSTPAFFGFPFFYWYQFAWVLITAAITGLVYLLTNKGPRP